MAACYSPGPDGEPELPFEPDDCSLREDVWERWLEWDPVRMLADHLDDLRPMRAISLESGLQDEYNLHAGTADPPRPPRREPGSSTASSSSRASTAT